MLPKCIHLLSQRKMEIILHFLNTFHVYVLVKDWLKAVTAVRSEKGFDICREKGGETKSYDKKRGF